MITDHGWNTWDFRRLLAFSFLDGGRERLSVRVSFLDDLERERRTDFRWRDLVRVGPHATDGSYAKIEVRAAFESEFAIEAAADGETLHLEVTPTRTSGLRPVVEIAEPGAGRARREGDRLEAAGWRAAARGAIDRDRLFVSADHPYFAGGRGERLTVVCSLDAGAALDPGAARARIDAALQAQAAGGLTGEGALAGAPEALMRSIAWNTIHDRSGRGIATLISRDWSRDWRAAVLFGWDTFFVAMMAALEDPELAWRNLEAVLAGVTRDGFVPNWRFSNGAATLDRSHPPVGGLALSRIAATAPDDGRLRSLLPKLLRWHAWWNEARDRGGDGLLSWGSSAEPGFEFPEMRQVLRSAAICGAYESGLDNSPLFDGVPFDAEAGTLMAADVGLNALHAADAEALAELGDRVGLAEEAGRLRAEHRERCRRIRERLWDPDQATFANRAWTGAFTRRIAPTSFYPLLTGAATPEQARALVASQLEDERGFKGEWMVPSIRRDDAAFLDQDYWRGRVWPSMNFLTVTALRRAGFRDPAHAVVRSGLEMFLRGWRERSHVYENYSALTGEGGDVPNSDPFYAWGSLLPYLAIGELFDVERDGAFTFGARADFDAGVRNLRILGDRWHVRSGPDGLLVRRGDEPLIEATTPCRITGFRPGAIDRPLRVDAPTGCRIRLHALPPNEEVRIDWNGDPLSATADREGRIEIRN